MTNWKKKKCKLVDKNRKLTYNKTENGKRASYKTKNVIFTLFMICLSHKKHDTPQTKRRKNILMWTEKEKE